MADASANEPKPRSSLLQATLDAFVAASRTAVGNMSPTKQNFSKKTFEALFFELPAEIRCIIYSLIFTNARLVLKHENLQTLTPRGNPTLKKVNIEEILNNIHGNKAALLRASDFCKKEAIYYLASCTTVIIEGGWGERKDLLAIIDHDFLRYVQGVRMFPDTFIRADRSLLPNLRYVTLSAESAYSGSISVDEMVHLLRCDTCGDPQGVYVYELFVNWMESWDWKRKQLLHLARENGWKIGLVLYEKLGSSRSEIEYRLDTEVMVSKRLYRRGTLVLKNRDFKNEDKILDLGINPWESDSNF